MKGKTNSRSGGISSKNALLMVCAPFGSIITATVGSTTKTSSTGIVLSDDPTREMHLFSIPNTQFGMWTVTATVNRVTNTQTIVINASDEYDLVFKCLVPDGYQAVEYIGGTGTQYIDCNIVPAVDFKFNYKYAFIANTGSGDALSFGRSTGGTYRMTVSMDTKKYNIYIANPSKSINLAFSSVVANQMVEMSFEQATNSQTVILDGSTQTATIDTSTISGVDYCHLLHYRTSNAWRTGAGQIASLVMYNNGTMVRDFRPCYRLSDSVIGLWDTISNTLFTNAGTGTFVVGNDLN